MQDDSLFHTQRHFVERRVAVAGDPVVLARVRWIFWIAAGYGLMALLPLYLRPPVGLSYPVYYYGFLGVACAWQVAFLIVAQDAMRFRLVILPAILEKLGFGVAALVLYAQGRAPMNMALAGTLDLAFAAAFAWSFVALSRSRD